MSRVHDCLKGIIRGVKTELDPAARQAKFPLDCSAALNLVKAVCKRYFCLSNARLTYRIGLSKFWLRANEAALTVCWNPDRHAIVMFVPEGVIRETS